MHVIPEAEVLAVSESEITELPADAGGLLIELDDPPAPVPRRSAIGSTPALPPATVTLAQPVTFGTQLGVSAALLVFGLAVAIPVFVLAWAAVSAAAAAAGGAALVYSGGLEPETFATALFVGLGVALVLVVVASLASRGRASGARAEAGSAPSSTSWFARHPIWSRHPVLWTIAALGVASALATLAAWTRSPFFPYPFATILVVATFAFVAIAALVASYRILAALARALFRWSCGGPYRAGFVTATLLMIGAASGWALQAGWTARPLRAAGDALALDRLPAPATVAEAGQTLFCAGADRLEPTLTRTDHAPLCDFLPTD